MLELSVRRADWQAAIRELAVAESEKIRLVLEAVGIEVIDYLKSHQLDRLPPHKTQPPPPGPYHPGGWRDITSLLVNSYQPPAVTPVDGGWRLTLANTAEYAVYLEARDGFFVLSGVTDPGGPVEDALAEVIPLVAPGWTLRRAG